MKMPQIETITNFDGVLALLADPSAMAAKLQELKNMQDWINERLAAYGEIKDIESEKSRANASLTEAIGIKKQAEALKEVAGSEAADIIRVAEEHAGNILESAKGQQFLVEANERDVASKATAARLEKEEAEKLKVSSEVEMAHATRMMEQAKALQAEYQGKLDEFAELAKRR